MLNGILIELVHYETAVGRHIVHEPTRCCSYYLILCP